MILEEFFAEVITPLTKGRGGHGHLQDKQKLSC